MAVFDCHQLSSFNVARIEGDTKRSINNKNIYICSKQFLQNKKTLQWLKNINFDMRFVDESHNGGTTDLAIFKDGIIRHTAVIPFGGNVITDDIKEGCSIIEKQAELLKVKFGSAWPGENKENEIVSIPGLRGREPKEISVKNLAHIIQARMEEIIENIYYEIKNSGYEKKLIAGIVVTGGGAQLKHIGQLVEYMTGMDTRIGYPNEHLAKGPQDVTSPVFATGVGLVIKGLQVIDKQNANKPKVVEQPKAAEEKTEEEIEMEKRTAIAEHSSKQKGSFFDKILQKGKQFFEEDAE